jgi:hypothetical protein
MSCSPPAKDKDLQDTTGKRPLPPPAEHLHLHPSTKQLELMSSIDGAPSTQQPIYETDKDSSSSGFFISG